MKPISQNHLAYCFLLAVSFSIPLSIRINGFLLIVGVAASVFYCVKNHAGRSILNPLLLIFFALYAMHLVGLANSHDMKVVFIDLEQKLPLLILPPSVFFFSRLLTSDQQRMLLLAFVCATLLVCLWSFSDGFYWGYSSEELYTNLLVRRPYLGMYCVLCIFFCALSIRSDRTDKWVLFPLILFFSFYLIVLFAKMALVTLPILAILVCIWFFLTRRMYRTLAVVFFAFVCSAFYMTTINESGRQAISKIRTFSTFSWGEYDAAVVNSLNMRFTKWRCSYKVLTENYNWFVGAGTGDTQDLLNKCYEDVLGPGSFFIEERLNSHNQYFSTWLHLGLLPFLFFIFHFIYSLWLYFKRRHLLGLVFTVGIMLFCVTESLFEVQKGVVFYTFFQSLFLFQNQKIPTIK